MDTQDSATLRCEGCGHIWEARDTPGKARQCSKCRSRKIGEVDPDETINEESRPVEETEVEPERTTSRMHPPLVNEFLDDPDVKAKRKKLLMAKLDNQINEEQRKPSDETVQRLLLGWVKTISRSLYTGELLEEDLFMWYDCVCPWCRSGTMEYEEGEHGYHRWRCSECGRTVPE